MLEQLRLFLLVLEEGSLRRAAQRAHISQSAVTRQMQLLEHDLGGRLLERTSAGVRPTSGGHGLAQKARLLLGDYDSLMAEARQLVRGAYLFRISCSSTSSTRGGRGSHSLTFRLCLIS